MKKFSAPILRSVATIVAAGILSVTGISAASALSNVDACRFYYQEAGFSNPGACISSLYTAGR
ncbi:hypothetical protein [Arthrobacter humicola]|jgi:hypothetical protein